MVMDMHMGGRRVKGRRELGGWASTGKGKGEGYGKDREGCGLWKHVRNVAKQFLRCMRNLAKRARNVCETSRIIANPRIIRESRETSAKHRETSRNMRETCEMPCVNLAKRARNVCETLRPPRRILAVHRDKKDCLRG